MEMNFENFDQTKTYPRHPHSHRNGGFHMNFVEDTNLSSIVGALIKQIGQKISKGDLNLATLNKPVQMTRPMTMLEALSNDYRYSHFYNEAANTKDLITRIQLIIIQAIAGVHVNQLILGSRAPIDCSIGETLQLKKDDGTQFFAEFIKADPPTSLIQLQGPQDLYKLWASDEVFAEIHPTFTQIIGKTVRKRYLRFKDGMMFEITMPIMIVEGVINGDRILNFMDSFEISCPKENIYATINFLFQHRGKVNKLAKKLSGFLWTQNKQEPLQDLVQIEIYKKITLENIQQHFPLSKGSGSWLSYIEFDKQIMWRYDDNFLSWKHDKDLLRSDSFFRLDRSLMLETKFDSAQKARQQIEQDDRKNSQLRIKSQLK